MDILISNFDIVFLMWLMHVALATVPSAPIVFFGRKKVHWRFWELLVLILPFVVWCFLRFSDLDIEKTMGNFLELYIIALAVPVAALMRVAIGSRVSERLSAGVLIATVCVVAAGLFFLVPPIPGQ